MFIMIFSLVFLALSVNHADISKLRTYPSGITVTFKALEGVELEVAPPANPPKWAWQRRKLEKDLSNKLDELKSQRQMIQYSRFLRVINSTSLKEGEFASLDFYNKNDEIISQQTITNTTKPTPKYIFFMDRQTGRAFKGYLDNYYIPKDALYFKINFYDSDQNIIFSSTHPDFENNSKILISQYNNYSPKRPVMIQIELLGSQKNSLTRVGGFYFP